MAKMYIIESESRCPYHRSLAGLKWTACNHPKYLFDAALKMCEGLESEMCPLEPAPPKEPGHYHRYEDGSWKPYDPLVRSMRRDYIWRVV